MEKRRDALSQRTTAIPPLNLSRLDSENVKSLANLNNKSLDTDGMESVLNNSFSNNNCLSSIVEASQTILYTGSSLHRTVNRSLTYLGNDNLHTIFSTTLYKLRASTEKLGTLLDIIEKRPSPDLRSEIAQAAANCICVMKELCWSLRTRLSTLAQGLDAKSSRNLLLNIYGATIDIKEAWETIRHHLTIDPLSTLASLKPGASSRNRSHSEILTTTPTTASPIASPYPKSDNSQLYLHLRNAVANSLHVLNGIKQFVEETKSGQIPASLENKLNELLRITQYAAEMSNRLDKLVEANMGQNKDELLLLPTREETSRRIWEDTSVYLKAIVSVMNSIRLIQTEEEFTWSKSIRQGCLYVTRMTAEVAKIWNSNSTFAEDGFFLGRQERSASISEASQCSSPATDIPIQHTTNISAEQ